MYSQLRKNTLFHLIVDVWKLGEIDHFVLNTNAGLDDDSKCFLRFISVPHVGTFDVDSLGDHMEKIGANLSRWETDSDNCSARANVLDDILVSFQNFHRDGQVTCVAW